MKDLTSSLDWFLESGEGIDQSITPDEVARFDPRIKIQVCMCVLCLLAKEGRLMSSNGCSEEWQAKPDKWPRHLLSSTDAMDTF